MTGVSGLAGDPAYPLVMQRVPPLPLGKAGDVLADGFNALVGDGGRRTQPSSPRIMTVGRSASISARAERDARKVRREVQTSPIGRMLNVQVLS